MIESNCGKYALELIHNRKIINNTDHNMVFSTIYHQIIDISRNSPLYLIYPSTELQNFAIQIKDLSLQLSDMLKSYFESNKENPLKQLRLVSSSSDFIEIKTLAQPTAPRNYSIHIQRVATGQINSSKFVAKKICPFTSQTFSFHIKTSDESFDFEIPVSNNSTNEAILTKIQTLIHNTTRKLDAWLEEKDSMVSLHLQARAHRRNQPAHFTIKDNNSNGIISYYGLDQIATTPQPSDFSINAEPYHSYGVAFEIDELFELSLLKPCADEIQVAFEIDSSSISNEIVKLKDTINHLLAVSHACPKDKLQHELTSFLIEHKAELEDIGINLDNSNMLYTNQEQLESSIKNAALEEFFSEKDSFSQELLEHTHTISINPMEYVPNKIVAYKDHRKANYPNPYLTSMYSGFLFTNCC